MKTAVGIVVCAGVWLHAMPAVGAEQRIVAPRGSWTVTSHKERCSLVREFGDEDDLRLRIDSFGPGSNFQFTLSGKLVPFKRRWGTEIRLGYTPDTGIRDKFRVVHGQIGSRASVTFPGGFFPVWSTIDQALVAPGQKTTEQKAELGRIGLEFTRQVTDITIEFPLQEPLKILTGSMAEPIAALGACVNDLITKWGFDPATHRNLAREPAPLPETLEAARQALSGLSVPRGITAIPARVRVDESGRATECVVQIELTVRVADFLCAGLKGGYTPALDPEGRPAASMYTVAMYIYSD